MIKKFLKRRLQTVAACTGRHRWPFPSGQLLVLMYHRILPRQDPRAVVEQPGMIVEPETLRMHLRLLKRHFTLVSLGDWVRRQRERRPVPTRACAVTFDDGWRDNYEYAFPIIREEQVPMTIFLVAGMVGSTRKFWPERLALILQRATRNGSSAIWHTPPFRWLDAITADGIGKPFDPEGLDRVICRAKALPDLELHDRIDEMEVLLGPDGRSELPSILDWEQVHTMVHSGLVDVGSHTSNHIRLLPGIDTLTLNNEIAGSRQMIRERTGHPVDAFCFPNGDRTPEATAAVRANYAAACTTSKGWNSTSSDPFYLRRIGIHQDIAWDETTFLARLSGWI